MLTVFVAFLLVAVVATGLDCAEAPWSAFTDGAFHWRASGPLLAAEPTGPDPQVSIKDPSIVYWEGRWHLFATVRMKSGKVGVQYLSFADWAQAAQAPRTILALHDQAYGAPQVFFFTPQQRWYLVYQLHDKNRTPSYGPFFSTTENLADPHSWTKPAPLVPNAPEQVRGLDFWVICDERKAHLFNTTLDGHMWRREADKADFPGGWSEAQLALHADIFEASHTYRLRGLNQYLTVVEAQGDARRYYKAYLAEALAGPWEPLADTWARPFAGIPNVEQDEPWTTNLSHGELIRAGVDEYLEVDPANPQFLFQGASDPEYRGHPYGQIPWRLGMLRRVP